MKHGQTIGRFCGIYPGAAASRAYGDAEREPSGARYLGWLAREPHLRTPFTFVDRDRRARAHKKGGKIRRHRFASSRSSLARHAVAVRRARRYGIHRLGKIGGLRYLLHLAYYYFATRAPFVTSLSLFPLLSFSRRALVVAVATVDLKRR